ncbi:GDSL esterase/lipase 7-like [Papaver somniferum]|uniref:GDSL esterase/lipase 7-like n=1 Tax=Papaver somniferum TaxID=3469 RepID=UPI000E7039D5|nr:GDSL esterase/lipase 7-like [Papaver somniferum]
MVKYKLISEIDVAASADFLWPLLSSKEIPKLAKKLLPNKYEKVEVLEGDGGLGTVVYVVHPPEFASTEALKLPLEDNVRAPALYVFGDSLVDSGNNNYLQTLAKVNYTPYGVDFRNGPTGRFNNGKTVVDFIASWLGLPYVPAYLGLSEKQKRNTKTGINYASGAAGILKESGTVTIGDNLSLEEQVNYFTKTVKIDLPKIFKTRQKISQYLSKSIFVISIGSNDYINNYLQPALYNSSKIYNPQQYADHLVSNLKKHLMSIYKSGARKFVVFELGPVGCTPAFVFSATPKPTTPCVESMNSVVKIFNSGVTKMTKELTATLKGSTFIYADVFKKSHQENLHPNRYGFSGGNIPCCAVGVSTLCLPNQTPCANRNAHLYWDAFHPVQRVNYEIANGCFKGSTTCFPINIRQLAYL